MVHKPVFNIAIPFATVTSTFLLTSFKASAQQVTEGGIVRPGAYTDMIIGIEGLEFEEPNSGIADKLTEVLTHVTGLGDIQKVLAKIEIIFDKLIIGFNWISYVFNHPNEVSIQFLTWIYETVSKVVLTTPTFIFNNPYMQNTSLTFSTVSISIVTILTIFEALMQMTKQKHTEFKTIVKRYFGVVCVTGFVPFLFEQGFTLLNKLTQAITKIGSAVNPTVLLKDSLPVPALDTLILFSFDIVLFAMLIPILLQNGRRWWDLMCLAVVAPLAGTAYVFDRHRHYFDTWWSTVKKLSLVQLVYAVFITLIGIFIFGTRDMVSGWGLIIKLLIVAGGLWRMLNPPRIVTSLTSGGDVTGMYSDYKNGFRQVVDTLTFKKFRPTTIAKNGLLNKVKSKFKK